jgi:hypothetical protein
MKQRWRLVIEHLKKVMDADNAVFVFAMMATPNI